MVENTVNIKMNKTLNNVKDFWEANPLWSGESKFEPGSFEYFQEHRNVVINDCFAGELDPETLPDKYHRKKVLDLGCGPGFWLIELSRLDCEEIVGADLTNNALALAQKRCRMYEVNNVSFSQQNAECLSFSGGEFDHVNCQGVIHHTPETEKAIAEIARVLKVGGTANISVYYKNIFLRNWQMVKWIGKLINLLGGGLRGRGRENIFSTSSVDEIVRLYDGSENPIGKSYTKREYFAMLSPWFDVEDTFLHFFPARACPIKIPKILHRFLDKRLGFMIYAKLRKKDTA